jgi:division protein CdvB (Snf7/Vps24/ESCRT-III family)
LSRKLIKEWEKNEEKSFFSQIGNRMLRRGKPLRERIAAALYRLKTQQNRLEGAAARIQQHDKELFNKCVNAQLAKDFARAKIYASECAEMRKMAKITLQCQLALEKVALRLETIEEFGEVLIQMGPVASIIQAVRSNISGIMPEVSYELGMIGETLNEIVLEVGEATGQPFDFEASGEEAQKILGEAGAIAEQRMKERFPELPIPASALTSTESTSESSLPK